MKLDIELERLKKIDFLELFEVKLDDYGFNGEQPCNFTYEISGLIYDIPYKNLRKYLKSVYKNLNKYNNYCIGCVNENIIGLAKKEFYAEKSQKIEKYFLNIKLKNKFTEVRKTKVNKI